jgi:hypothetical protein
MPLQGSLMEMNYTVSSAGRPIVQISQKWITIKRYVHPRGRRRIDPGPCRLVVDRALGRTGLTPS